MRTGGDPDQTAPSPLGGLIRRQRELAELSLRQIADLAGISHPYLSQIERRFRAPSAEVLTALADSVQTSADLLRVHRDDAGTPDGVIEAINAETDLTASQRRSLIETYRAFRHLTVDRRRARGRRP